MLRHVLTKQFWTDLHAEVRGDSVLNGAAALGFYLTLAIFPALVILLTIVPYLPLEAVENVILDLLQEGPPEEAAELVRGIVSEVTKERREGLLSFGVLATLWAATAGMYAIMRQLNVTMTYRRHAAFSARASQPWL